MSSLENCDNSVVVENGSRQSGVGKYETDQIDDCCGTPSQKINKERTIPILGFNEGDAKDSHEKKQGIGDIMVVTT